MIIIISNIYENGGDTIHPSIDYRAYISHEQNRSIDIDMFIFTFMMIPICKQKKKQQNLKVSNKFFFVSIFFQRWNISMINIQNNIIMDWIWLDARIII
mgnify:CR=1 FL=1